jgi:uncharacterized OB-fold protein
MTDVDADVVASPPRPQEDASSAFFWEGARQGRLLILRCDDCGYYIHWPRPICRRCLSTSLNPAEVSGRGEIYSFTIARRAFHPWFLNRIPYVIAVIDLVEQPGLRMVSNIVGCEPESVKVGLKVAVEFQEVAPDLVLPLFHLMAHET